MTLAHTLGTSKELGHLYGWGSKLGHPFEHGEKLGHPLCQLSHSLVRGKVSLVTLEELGTESLLVHLKRSQVRWLGHLFGMLRLRGALGMSYWEESQIQDTLEGLRLLAGPGSTLGSQRMIDAETVAPDTHDEWQIYRWMDMS